MDERVKHWERMGKHFGYPKCCIDSFVKRATRLVSGLRAELTSNQQRVHNHTGFIPCDECSKDIVRGEKSLEGLIDTGTRTCKYQFPTDEMDMGDDI